MKNCDSCPKEYGTIAIGNPISSGSANIARINKVRGMRGEAPVGPRPPLLLERTVRLEEKGEN